MSIQEIGIQEMRSAGFNPGDENPAALNEIIEVWLTHEDQSMREHVYVRRSLDEKELLRQVEALQARGFTQCGENLQCFDFVAPSERPKLFLTKFKGTKKELSVWILGDPGRILPNGIVDPSTIRVGHIRSWAIGMPGRFAKDKTEVMDYLKTLVPHRFSRIVELPLDEFLKLR